MEKDVKNFMADLLGSDSESWLMRIILKEKEFLINFLIFWSNLNKNQLASAPGCPRAISFHFQLELLQID